MVVKWEWPVAPCEKGLLLCLVLLKFGGGPKLLSFLFLIIFCFRCSWNQLKLLIHYFTLSYFILPNPFLAFCPCFWFNITELQCKMGPKMSYSLVSVPYENGFS